MRLQRPRQLLTCAVLGASLLLSACGFHLRGAGVDNIKLDELHVVIHDQHSQTHQQLLEALRANQVKVSSSAPYHLQFLDEIESRREMNKSKRSGPIEFELNQRVSFQITNQTGRALVGPETVSAHRTYVHDQNNVVGSSEEEAMLQREMRQELIRQLMFRLSRITANDLAAREQALEHLAD